MVKQVSKFLTAVVVLGSIALITLMFPKLNSLEHSVGERWNHDDLIANHNFVVEKSDEEIALERNSLERSQLPVYDYQHVNVAEDFASFLSSLFESNIDSSEVVLFRDYLNDSYDIGVLSSADARDMSGKYLILHRADDSHETSVEAYRTSADLVNRLKNFSILGLNSTFDPKPNLFFNKYKTQELLDARIANLNSNAGQIKQGDVIVFQGQQISESISRKIGAYKDSLGPIGLNSQSSWIIFFGYFLLTCLIIGALVYYLQRYFLEIYGDVRKLLFVLMWPVLFSFLVYLIERETNLSTYIIPFCIIPIVIKNFYADRLALFIHVVTILIASFISELGYEFTFLQILAGIVAILVVSKTRYWNAFFISIGLIFLTYLFGYIGLSMIKEGSFASIDWSVIIFLGINALLTIMAYPFIPLIEKLFGFISDISLAELADLNKPLLKEMSIKAPGTLQHSLQVANLSEAAAEKIGADSLLLKVGALYHDIGKIAEPQYFIENQSGDNPHTTLSNFESAKKIVDHVIEGEKMARKARLPGKLIEFIRSHHGTTRVEYFYRNQLSSEPDREFDEVLFRYPGPKPKTKEEAILMIADSLEAASKSLKNPTGKDIDELVDKIVAGKISNEQLTESALTFSELEQCVDVFKSLLKSINHVRVEYPDEVSTGKSE